MKPQIKFLEGICELSALYADDVEGNKNVEKITGVSISFAGFDLDISQFKNKNGESVCDVLGNNHYLDLEKIIKEHEENG